MTRLLCHLGIHKGPTLTPTLDGYDRTCTACHTTERITL